ncbi:protein kinase [Nocardiopsis sediminis]|uniref:non-specific serine/threonine protein kinase n=1 Tax=Nocardiopsis sediminis TaxID=1778267 RepID=A0ABV8FK24_9ACTN
MERVLDGRYRLVERLGAGGMGEVWRSVDDRLDRPVAVKLIRPEHVGSTEIVARFQREARLTARLAGHPNVVILHDVGEHEDSVYAVMELVRGRTFSAIVRTTGPPPVAQAADWIAQAASGLAAAHGAGIVHRDVKPGNLMVVDDGTVKVLDFGIAGFTDAAAQSRRLTRTGAIFGTPLYMSPEQIRGETVTAAGDLYSLGTILYQLLTGVAPFKDPDPMRVIRMHLVEAPRPPAELRSGIPADLAALATAMLEKTPDRRPSGDEVRARLEPFLMGGSSRPHHRVTGPDALLSGPNARISGPRPAGAAPAPPEPAARPAAGPASTGAAVPPATPPAPAPAYARPPSSGPAPSSVGAARRALEQRLEAAEERARAGLVADAASELHALVPDLIHAYGADHPETLRARRRAAYLTGKGGDPGRSVALFTGLLADLDRVYGRRHPETLTARYYLATNSGRAGDHATAARVHEELLPDLSAVHGPDSERVLTTRLYLAFDVGETGDRHRAVALLHTLVPDLARALGADHATTLRARHYLAAYIGYAGDPAEAVRHYDALLRDHHRVFGAQHAETARAAERLAHWRRRAAGR